MLAYGHELRDQIGTGIISLGGRGRHQDPWYEATATARTGGPTGQRRRDFVRYVANCSRYRPTQRACDAGASAGDVRGLVSCEPECKGRCQLPRDNDSLEHVPTPPVTSPGMVPAAFTPSRRSLEPMSVFAVNRLGPARARWAREGRAQNARTAVMTNCLVSCMIMVAIKR